jgi:hypothetical protein
MLDSATAMRTGEVMAAIGQIKGANRAADRLRDAGRYPLAGTPREIR